MDIFDEEIIKFWKALAACGVRYIMVGGYATNLNGYQRYTGDMDLWIDDTIENRRNLRTAFSECEMGDYYMLETMQIIPGWTSFNLNNGLKLDLMLAVKGLEGFTFAMNVSPNLTKPISMALLFPFCISIILFNLKKLPIVLKTRLMLYTLRK